MWLDYVLHFTKPKRTYNHADICIDGWNSGAVSDSGLFGIFRARVRRMSLKESYEGKKRELYVFPLPFDAQKQIEADNFLRKVNGTKYEYSNLFHFINVIFGGEWKGKTGDAAMDKIFCTELGAYIANIYFKDLIKTPYKCSPNDLIKALESIIS